MSNYTFIIIDILGAVHATIKATHATQALKIYKDGSTIFDDAIMAICKEDLKVFKQNIKNIKL